MSDSFRSNALNVACVVPLSGGKDSQACLKLALQYFSIEQIRGLFCNTQFEHPWTYAHIERLRTMYGPLRIDTATGGSVDEKCIKHKRFPGGGARHCTDELKIRETRIYIRALAEQQGQGFEVWYGMRTGESSARERKYEGRRSDELHPPHEIMPRKYPKLLSKMGVSFCLAILDWTEQQVLNFCAGELNPLYEAGFERVGCFPCLAAGDAYKEKAFAFGEFGASQKQRVIHISSQIGKSIWTSKGGLERNEPPCSICAE